MELKKILVGIEGIKAKGSLDIKISNFYTINNESTSTYLPV